MAKWITAILLLFGLAAQGLAIENRYIDSLKRVESESRVDSAKLNALTKLAVAYSDSAYNTSIAYWKKALLLANKTKNRKILAHIHHQIGYMLFNKGEFPEALHEYKNALAVYEFTGNSKGVGQTYNDIGIIYKTWGKYELALENFLKGLTIFDQIADSYGISMVSNNIGQIYFYREDYHNAIKYFTVYLEVNQKDKYHKAVAAASNNIAAAYMELKDYDMALKHYKQSMFLYDSLGIKIGVAILSDNIGMLFAKKGDHSEALRYHTTGLELFKELSSFPRMSHTLKNIGYSHLCLGNLKSAISYLHKGEALAKEYQQRETEKEIYFNLSEVYQRMNRPAEALHYFKQMSMLKDSLLNAETKENLTSIELRYEAEKKNRELSFMQEELVQQKTFRVLMGIAILLFVTIALLLVFSNHKKQQKVEKYHQRNIFLVNTLQHTIQNLCKPIKFDNGYQIKTFPQSRVQRDDIKTDIFTLSHSNLNIVVSIAMAKTHVSIDVVKVFLRNELQSIMAKNPFSSIEEIVTLTNNKLLFINDLIGLKNVAIDTSYIFINCSERKVVFYGKTCAVWINSGDSILRLHPGLMAHFERNNENAIYILTHGLELNTFDLYTYFEKTINSISNSSFNDQNDILNSAAETWILSQTECEDIHLAAIKSECTSN